MKHIRTFVLFGALAVFLLMRFGFSEKIVMAASSLFLIAFGVFVVLSLRAEQNRGIISGRYGGRKMYRRENPRMFAGYVGTFYVIGVVVALLGVVGFVISFV